MGDIMRHSDEKICPHCGGQVIWTDTDGAPMSPYKRMQDANRHLRLGCLYGIIAIIGCIILYFLASWLNQ